MPNIVRRTAHDESAVHPIPAAVAVVPREGHVLLVRRANPPYAGRWGFPGGKIEAGETIEAAAMRELAEETSVNAQACKILTAFDVFDHDDRGRLTRHFVLIAVLCKWISGEPIAADDALQAQWFRLEDLDEADPSLNLNVVAIARDADNIVRRGGRS